MTSGNDKKISQLTVKLTKAESTTTIGTGIIYYQKSFGDNVYILTAAHCLFDDGDKFQHIFQQVNIDLYVSTETSYRTITVNVQENLLFKDIDKDLGILCLNKSTVESIIGAIPIIHVVRERLNFDKFTIKGFPNATKGEELAIINAIWLQNMTIVDKFQLRLTDDYTNWATQGFSGSGVFFEANNEIYLYGIFTRFRSEDKGRVIYCQFLENINVLLRQNYLPTITFSYLGEHGLTPTFFKKHIDRTIESLGNRYDKILNFKLPIAQRFNDIAKDEYFKQRLINIIDKWLSDDNWKKSENNVEIGSIEQKLTDLQNSVKIWLLSLKHIPDEKLELDEFLDKLNQLEVKVDETILSLYSKRELQEKGKKIKRDYSYRPPFENEIARLREINSQNNNFLNNLSKYLNISLANNPVMIIQGEAGSGKSHLLGDIVIERLSNKLPTLLLHGHDFSSNRTIESNILDRLDLNCSFEGLLTACNNIGIQIGSRFLILIDAINETHDTRLWQNQLAGFIKAIESYPFVGLVITVRDTYYEDVISDQVRKKEDITILKHEGFKGNEYEALKLFCDIYKLEQPRFPILAPEFSKPLFLKLICEGVIHSSDKKFPSGFQGINKIFDYYTDSLNRIFQSKKEYRLKSKLVNEAIHVVANQFYKNETRYLSIDKANVLFDEKFNKFPSLLSDLIQEGVFIKNTRKNYFLNTSEDVVLFTYERYGDFYIASQLLQKYSSNEEILKAGLKENELGKLLSNYHNNGIIEALSVIIPEKYELEIFEVFDWVFTEKRTTEETHYHNEQGLLNYAWLDSLKWRTAQSINNDKVTAWVKGEHFDISDNNYLYYILGLTTYENHPFNSDRLFDILNSHSMATRDSFWQEHILGFKGVDDDNQAYPLRRLIEWAWTPNISSQTTYETARLAGQTLAWVLSTTDRVLRDQTTKAMVNLLEQQPEALISILNKFKDIDDLYILERLYAVAYGCTLRTETNISIQKITQFTYDTIFKNENPPVHILLRDYARNIIEYAIYKKLSIVDFNVELIRPPYKSNFPVLPSEQDIEKYKLNHESDNYKNNRYGRLYNYVHFSVMDWDFGNKIVSPKISYFSPVSFILENQYKSWIDTLTRKQKQLIKYILDACKGKEKAIAKKKNNLFDVSLQEKLDWHLNRFDDSISFYNSIIEQVLNNENNAFFHEKVMPHFTDIYKTYNSSGKELDSKPIRRWIVQRVFELGYDVKIHGKYDSFFTNFSDYSSKDNIERISKKYQWIAYYEILAYLTDNYKLKDSLAGRDKYEYFKGTWQLYLRNIDPVYLTKSSDDEDEQLFLSDKKFWWSEKDYLYWNDGTPTSKWVGNLVDLPNAKDFILKCDDDGNEWVNLEHFYTWKQPKALGKDKYADYQRIQYLLNAYIINKKDKIKIVNSLQGINLWGNEIPKNNDSGDGILNREKFWSPAYFDSEKESQWINISTKRYKVIVTTTNAKGYIDGDKSGANKTYNIPCKTLFEGLGLQYSRLDGDFKEENGKIIVKANSEIGVLVRKDYLFEYLDANDFDIVWAIAGEKLVKEQNFNGHRDYYHGSHPCGVFYFEENNFNGEFKIFNRD